MKPKVPCAGSAILMTVTEPSLVLVIVQFVVAPAVTVTPVQPLSVVTQPEVGDSLTEYVPAFIS